MNWLLISALLFYVLFVSSISLYISRKSRNESDFLVGGRQFGLWLTSFSLFATWFGAGTLMSATDEIAAEGLKASALEPYGAGMCLILAGLFFAKPLWNMKIFTYSDLFKKHYGNIAEGLSVFLNIPIYVGWVAVQFVALANILAVFFPIPIWLLILLIAGFAVFLTVTGGLWTVSITDSAQLVLIVIGLIYLVLKVLSALPDEGVFANTDPKLLILIPSESFAQVFDWIALFCIAALGNMTGQDLGQRIFSARNAKTAQIGCLLAGIGYMVFGSIPVFLALTTKSTLGAGFEGSVVPLLIQKFLDPISAVLLTMAIVSAVISTITSALLAPSATLANNCLKYYFSDISQLALCRWAVVLIAFISIATAYMGESAYGILESSYAVGFVAFFAPVSLAIFLQKTNAIAGLTAMIVGVVVWLPEFFGNEDLPFSLIAVAMSFASYFLAVWWQKLQIT